MISLRQQLTRRLLRTTLALLALGLAALVAAAGYALVYQFDLALRAKALALDAATTLSATGEVQVQSNDRLLSGFDGAAPRDFFQVWRRDGTTIARSRGLGGMDLPQHFGKYDRPKYIGCTLPNGRTGRVVGYVFRPKAPAGVTAPEVFLAVASDRGDLDATLRRLLGLAAVCAVLLATATLWVVPRVLRQGLEPLAALGEQTAQIDAGSLATRFPEENLPAELQPIAKRLNALLARLEQSFDRERRFSANLAHELRTPLAELQSLAENALKWPEARDPETDRETLAIARQMEALVSRMLTLARGEQGQLASRPEPVALASSVRAAWAPFAARAAERSLRVEWALGENITGRADPVLLRSILGNLFDNAVDYTPAGGAIAVRLTLNAGRAEIAVSNPAGTLTGEDVARLFERFWRKEAARSGSGHHAGLGLPLARSFAEAMEWTLTAALEAEGRLVFRLAGPVVE